MSPCAVLPPSLADERDALLRWLDPFLRSTGSGLHGVSNTPQCRALQWLDGSSFGAADHFDLRGHVVDVKNEDVGGAVVAENEEDGRGNALPAPPPDVVDRLIQRYVLAVLYYSLHGDGGGDAHALRTRALHREVTGWKDESNFLSDAHECDWSNVMLDLGVTCDADMRVVEINLRSNNLFGRLPPGELHGLGSLTKIDLSYNTNIVGPLPDDIGSLTNLETLMLAHNSLTGTLPASYGNLTSLREFSLVDNKLRGSVPPEVGNMKSLVNIWMNQNEFTDGMDNFCESGIDAAIFYADCFCRNFPRLEREVDCECCTICCAGEGVNERCHPNSPCT